MEKETTTLGGFEAIFGGFDPNAKANEEQFDDDLLAGGEELDDDALDAIKNQTTKTTKTTKVTEEPEDDEEDDEESSSSLQATKANIRMKQRIKARIDKSFLFIFCLFYQFNKGI